MQIQRLCLFLARISEAEPLDLGSHAEPRNHLKPAKIYLPRPQAPRPQALPGDAHPEALPLLGED